jgi:cytoskeletal protein RodZ
LRQNVALILIAVVVLAGAAGVLAMTNFNKTNNTTNESMNISLQNNNTNSSVSTINKDQNGASSNSNESKKSSSTSSSSNTGSSTDDVPTVHPNDPTDPNSNWGT